VMAGGLLAVGVWQSAHLIAHALRHVAGG
jgi:hypothetical protein